MPPVFLAVTVTGGQFQNLGPANLVLVLESSSNSSESGNGTRAPHVTWVRRNSLTDAHTGRHACRKYRVLAHVASRVTSQLLPRKHGVPPFPGTLQFGLLLLLLVLAQARLGFPCIPRPGY
eukprot:491001-Rhodomonas_salina.1